MSQTSTASSLPPSMWDRGYDRAVAWFKDRKVSRAKDKLERELFQIVNTANGHQAKGLPAGSPAYVELYRQATGKIDTFCTTHRVDRLSIEQQVPVLRELEQLTHSAPPGAMVIKGLGILGAAVVCTLLVGCASGLIVVGYAWMTHLLVH